MMSGQVIQILLTIIYNKLIALCVDICRRNGKTKLLWIPDKDRALAYEPKPDEMLLTVHRWFANKSCPGDWLVSRLPELADRVTRELAPSASATKVVYNVVVGSFENKKNAQDWLEKVKVSYPDAFIKATVKVKS